MVILRPSRAFHYLVILLAATVVASSLTACGIEIPFLDGDQEETYEQEERGTYGPCWPTYGSEVESVSVSADGSRVLYLSGSKPENWPDDMGWSRSDKAIYVREGGAARYIATTWSALDVIPSFATPEPGEQPEQPQPLEEDMREIWLSRAGDRFVVAVGRIGVGGQFAKLYAGTVPPLADGSLRMEPGEGGALSLIGINSYRETEGVGLVALSDDGSKIAAAIGSQSELRAFNLDTETLTVYDIEEDEVVVKNELPPVETDLSVVREPAVTGVQGIAWSPDGQRIALSREEGVGDTSVSILEVSTGEVTVVRVFQSSTLPHVVWNTDGRSLFVMTTKLSQGTIFGDTEIRHVAAAEDGQEIHDGGKLPRPLGYRTEPVGLVGFGDNEHFFFRWESMLWRLTAPGGEPAKASYLRVTPDTYLVSGPRVSVSPETERVVFVAVDGSRQMVGERLHALADQCPIGITPEAEGDTPPEGGEGATTDDAQAAPVDEAESGAGTEAEEAGEGTEAESTGEAEGAGEAADEGSEGSEEGGGEG